MRKNIAAFLGAFVALTLFSGMALAVQESGAVEPHTVMASVAGSILTLDGDAWLLATDPKNEGLSLIHI